MLELFSTDFVATDGYVFFLKSRYEFALNEPEFVNSLACVPLETVSTESGNKDFIAVGTPHEPHDNQPW